MEKEEKTIPSHTFKIGNKVFIPLGIAICIAGFLGLFIPKLATSVEPYTDLIVEYSAISNLSKTPEYNFFWMILIIGMVFLAGSMIFFKKKSLIQTKDTVIQNNTLNVLILFATAAPFLIAYVSISTSLPVYYVMGFYLLAIVIFRREIFFKALTAFLLTYFSVISVLSLLSYFLFIPNFTELIDIFTIISLSFLTAILVNKTFSEEKVNAIILILQIPIPLSLTLFLQNKYLYDGVVVKIPFPVTYTFFILIIMFGLLIWSAVLINKKYPVRSSLTLNELILLPTVIGAFICASYVLPDLQVAADTHHPGENMLPWQQYFHQQQSFYTEYFPASGLSPMFFGFFQHVLLDGTVTDYSLAFIMAKILLCSVISILCYLHLGTFPSLCLSIFLLTNYDRYYLLLPSLLLLLLPKLIKSPNKWLQCWAFLCLINILYYPLSGGGFGLGTLPFAIVQFVSIIKDGTFKSYLKKPSFYIIWALILGVILYFTPLMLKLLTHAKLYGSQTLEADGMSLFYGNVPDKFFSWIPSLNLRYALYYMIRFAFPMVFVFIVVIFLTNILTHKNKTWLDTLKTPSFFGWMSTLIIILVAYTYTVVRFDGGSIMARNSYILSIFTFFVFILIYKYSKKNFQTRTLIILVGIIFSLSFFYDTVPILNSNLFSNPPTISSETMVIIDEEIESKYPRLGRGFVSTTTLAYLDTLNSQVEALQIQDKKISIPYLNPGQLLAYVLDLKVAGTGTTYIAKSRSTQEELIDIFEQDLPYFQNFHPFYEYHIYYWALVEQGYKPSAYGFWLTEEQYNERPELPDYESVDPRLTVDPPLTILPSDNSVDYVANSFGRAMDTFSSALTPKNPSYTASSVGMTEKEANVFEITDSSNLSLIYEFNEPLRGSENDFLRLKFSSDQIIPQESYFTQGKNPEHDYTWDVIKVSWITSDGLEQNTSIMYHFGSGELLLPLGFRTAWLLSDITAIRIDFLGSLNSATYLNVEEFQFYSLNKRESNSSTSELSYVDSNFLKKSNYLASYFKEKGDFKIGISWSN